MNLIDMHCDTLWKLMGADCAQDFMHNDCSVDIKGLKRAGSLVQFFACFILMKEFLGKSRYDQAYEYAKVMITRLKKEVWHYSHDLAMAYDYKAVMKNHEEDKISAMLTVEEGGIIHNKISRVEELYRMGVRLITLLWNEENCMGYPNSREQSVMQAGLKPFGFETIECMNDLGMIIDVSHMSDGCFWDTIRHSKAPIAASHSNARALCDHPRNLSDEMLKAVGEKGGVVGLNFYPDFLGENSLERMAEHLIYMMNLAGEDAVALGTDFDGFNWEDELAVPDIGSMDILANHLKQKGVSERQLKKIWSGNALRMIKIVL